MHVQFQHQIAAWQPAEGQQPMIHTMTGACSWIQVCKQTDDAHIAARLLPDLELMQSCHREFRLRLWTQGDPLLLLHWPLKKHS